MSKHAWLAKSSKEYAKYSLTNIPVTWEDGLRTDGSKGSYEWWYFDSKLDDGSSLVVTFYTGPIASFSDGFKPYATLTLTSANNERYESKVKEDVANCVFSKDSCDIHIGACYFKGDMKHYEIFWKDQEITISIQLDSNSSPWRPYTGHILFDTSKVFAWLPSVPEGTVQVDIHKETEHVHHTGTGYHDHNWGNTPMFFLMHHWYWGRAKIGDYQVVSSYITANKTYNYDEIPIFMLAKNGEILVEDAENYLTFTEEDIYYDEITKKHVANRLLYDYNDGNQHYRITYTRESDVERMGMETQLTKFQYVLIWLIGLRGSYQRMVGTATLEKMEGDRVVEKITSLALWELMYFGKDRHKK